MLLSLYGIEVTADMGNDSGDATATPWSNDGVGDEPSTNDGPWRQELKELSWQKLAIELCQTTENFHEGLA
jgi:hypothetical protein